MKYNIYCKKTHKLLATYTNEKTLETLDHSRCYYRDQEEENSNIFSRALDKAIENKKIISNKINLGSHTHQGVGGSSVVSNNHDDYMSPLNQVGYYAAISSMDSASSSSCDSSSSSDTSSSSSCDSGTW